MNFTKKMLRTAVLSGALIASQAQAGGGGVPVVDFGNIAQAMLQVQNQVRQIDQLRQQIRAATDNGNFGRLLNDPMVRDQLNKYLPHGYTDIFEAARNNDLGALQQVVNAAIAKEQAAQNAQNGKERLSAVRLLSAAQMDSMMQGMNMRSNRLQTLVNQINSTANTAQKQDLLNTISAESAMINLEMNRMQIMLKQAEFQERQAENQASREYANKAFR